MRAHTDTPDTASVTDDEPRDSIACSLNDEEFRARRAMIRDSLLSHALHTRKLESGLAIVFPDTDALRVSIDTFVSLERQCCGFLTFTVERTGDGLTLAVEGPPAAQATLETLAATIARR